MRATSSRRSSGRPARSARRRKEAKGAVMAKVQAGDQIVGYGKAAAGGRVVAVDYYPDIEAERRVANLDKVARRAQQHRGKDLSAKDLLATFVLSKMALPVDSSESSDMDATLKVWEMDFGAEEKEDVLLGEFKGYVGTNDGGKSWNFVFDLDAVEAPAENKHAAYIRLSDYTK